MNRYRCVYTNVYTRKSQRENKKYISFLIFVDKQYYLVYIYTYI